MAKRKCSANITDPNPPNEKLDKEERLGPKSYNWIKTLLSDDKYLTPTRYELFNARKDFDDFVSRSRKLRKLDLMREKRGRMLSALEACVNQFAEENKELESKQINLNLVKSKLLARSMTSKFENLLFKLNQIRDGVGEQIVKFGGIMELKIFSDELVSEFVGDLNYLNGCMRDYRDLKNEVLKYLER